MTRIIIASAVFVGTISIAWFSTSHKIPQPQPANILLSASITPTPVVELPAAPKARSISTGSFTTGPTPSPTSTQLVPQVVVTVSPTPHLSTSSTSSPHASSGPTATPSATSTPTSTPTVTPAQSGGITVTSLTTPVAQKQDATIKIQTDANATCTIEVTLPSGSISKSQELAPKTADQNGHVVWSWGINWNTKPGTAVIKLSCKSNDQTYSGETTMQIIASQ